MTEEILIYGNFWLTFCDDSECWDCIFIYVFQTFEARTRANQVNITGLGTIDLWHEFHIRKAVLKASGTRFSGRDESSCREPNFKEDEKLLWKSKTLLENLNDNLRRRCGPEGNLVDSIWQFYCLLNKKQRRWRVRTIGTLTHHSGQRWRRCCSSYQKFQVPTWVHK